MTADAVGGVWTVALDLAAGLTGRGVAVTLAVLGPPPSARQRDRTEAVAGLSLVETGEPLDWLAEDECSVRRSARAVARLAQETGADLVHLNAPSLALAEYDAPVLGACHSCVATWWRAVRGGDMPTDFAWRTSLLAEAYAACDTLIAPTQAFACASAAAYGIEPPDKILNGRAPLVVPAGTKTIVFTAGRLWDEGKNLAALDRAAAFVAAPVVAAGPLHGPAGQRVGFEYLAAVGPQDEREMLTRLSRAAVFVSVALYEPFGLAVLEAAQAGVALVLSDIPTFRELWDGAAVFVDPHDPPALARAVNDVLAHPARRKELAEAARQRAQNYGIDAMVDRMLAAYASLLPRARHAA